MTVVGQGMTAADSAPTWWLRLWDDSTEELLWSGQLPAGTDTLDQFLAERDDWTTASVDDIDGSRVWAGRIRLTDDGSIEGSPELDFIAPLILGRNPALPG